jgi:hypothetical protein
MSKNLQHSKETTKTFNIQKYEQEPSTFKQQKPSTFKSMSKNLQHSKE